MLKRAQVGNKCEQLVHVQYGNAGGSSQVGSNIMPAQPTPRNVCAGVRMENMAKYTVSCLSGGYHNTRATKAKYGWLRLLI